VHPTYLLNLLVTGSRPVLTVLGQDQPPPQYKKYLNYLWDDQRLGYLSDRNRKELHAKVQPVWMTQQSLKHCRKRCNFLRICKMENPNSKPKYIVVKVNRRRTSRQ
jgi:hypothetical protein